MWTAFTRAVSPTIESCELTYLARQKIDWKKADEQHSAYEACLTRLGVQIVRLTPLPYLPDATFVEDPAVILDQVAVLGRMAVASRGEELESISDALGTVRPVRQTREPGTLEGGDVIPCGAEVFVGLSGRTNASGSDQLEALLAPFGYRVITVPVEGCLHLKTACTSLGGRTILANRDWVDTSAFRDYTVIDVAPDEPWAANALRIGDTVLMAAGFPATERRLQSAGFHVETVDISELMKAEAGVTCLSLLFEN